jgi:uncharacterized DUF497 family protein
MGRVEREHIARHSVTQEEVEEVVFDFSAWPLRTRNRRYLFLGLTGAGRYLTVVLEPAPGHRAYVITARDMTDAEKDRFKGR